MTLQNTRINTVQFRSHTASPVVPSASVWDLGTRDLQYRHASSVRTLANGNRTNGRVYDHHAVPDNGVVDRIENRHGSRRALVLGVFMGFSMIVSAAIGGVFDDATPNNHAPVDYTAEIQSLDRR